MLNVMRFYTVPYSRRQLFALAGLLGTTAVATSACTTDVFTPKVNLNSRVLDAYGAAVQRSAEGDAWAPMFAEQADIVKQEFLRQCGTDRDGNPPQECVDALETPSATLPVEQALLVALQDGDPGGTLTGLYAAAATAQAAPELAEAKALNLDEVAAGHKQHGESLAHLMDLIYAAVYATGVAMAADGGAHQNLLGSLATRLRSLRGQVHTILESLGAEVPEPQAGYVSPDGTPHNAAEAARYLYTAIRPVTHQMRSLASMGNNPTAREFDARWAGLIARGEAGLEPIFGEDPHATAIRGE
ncbi:DUF4439 domain-containing protein [Corynebacterium sp. zg254]|uniref:DUF4439 domain-containing protein n=1 Tax=Corynebacterium zhongnanshanii TaxID=2768834 RepID=A0ABQ6VG11_9CORY|nr:MULTISPECIES: DUF4439 domain-containing protein [Corynebacterium]KAB3523357.1 DUF4439 domain-containing protein [Corynebacterium zhongnanshanii]MCR5913520.1 DUF4439 domain-containing protein [Corynebacterium sp. zg254]